MGFRKLDIEPKPVKNITADQALEILNDFADVLKPLKPWEIAKKRGAEWFPQPFSVGMVRNLCERFLRIETEIYKIMASESPPTTAAKMRTALVAALPNEPKAMVEAVGTKVVKVATTAGTWPAFRSALEG